MSTGWPRHSGAAQSAEPESITTVSDYGFRTCRFAAIRNDGRDSSVLKVRRQSCAAMDPTSLITALAGAQTGMVQLAIAARLERMNADQGASVVKLIDAAQQNIDPLANGAAGLGTNLDVSACRRLYRRQSPRSPTSRRRRSPIRPGPPC